MDINQFVQTLRNQGVNDAEISNRLRQAGWDDQTINSALQNQAVTDQSTHPSPIELAQRQESALKKQRMILVVASAVVLIVVVSLVAFALTRGSDSSTDEKLPEGSLLVKSRADSTGKSNAGRYTAYAEQYAANNNGQYPASASEANIVLRDYESEPILDPATDTPYTFVDSDPSFGEMQYRVGAECLGTDIVAGQSSRSIAFRTKLYSGEYFCQDNS